MTKEIDSVQRFVFEHVSIRGEIVRIEDTYQTIIHQQNYPPTVKQLLGEAIVSALLLTNSIKFKGHLSLQFQGDTRLPLLIVQCDNTLNIRAFAKYQENLNTEEYTNAFLHGQMALTIVQDDKTNTYQSLLPIQSTSMSEILMNYFAQSEQISTCVWLAVDEKRAAGMLLQLMPDKNSLEREQFWEYAVHLGQTVTAHELLTIDNTTLLHRLYHETELRVFDSIPTRFCCRCSHEKMKQVLVILGESEVNSLLKEQERIDIHCDFCNKHYTFDSIDVAMLFKH